MKKPLRFVSVASLVVLLCSPGVPQQAVAPPPRPADNGPSLAVTMQFIQEKLSHLGKINYAGYVHDNVSGNDWTVQRGWDIGYIEIHPESCVMKWHSRVRENGLLVVEGDQDISFGDVVDVVVMPVEQSWKEKDVKAGFPTRSYKADPPTFVVWARGKVGFSGFVFSDEDTANRIAKAMVHAVELCGGGNKDPF